MQKHMARRIARCTFYTMCVCRSWSLAAVWSLRTQARTSFHDKRSSSTGISTRSSSISHYLRSLAVGSLSGTSLKSTCRRSTSLGVRQPCPLQRRCRKLSSCGCIDLIIQTVSTGIGKKQVPARDYKTRTHHLFPVISSR